MADENTTASTSTTTEVTAPNPGTEASTGSTTEASPNPNPAPDGDEGAATILTPADDVAADKAADGTGEATKEGETEQKPAESADLFGAPDGDYALEGLPEGTVVDTEALAAVAPVAKELGLSNKGLSKIAGVYAEQVLPKVIENFQSELQGQITATHQQWATEATELVKTDPVFGGKPLKEVQQVAAKALDRLGGPELRKFLTDSGLGNNPAMVKFAYQAGAAISEEADFERGATGPKPKTREEKFYGPQS